MTPEIAYIHDSRSLAFSALSLNVILGVLRSNFVELFFLTLMTAIERSTHCVTGFPFLPYFRKQGCSEEKKVLISITFEKVAFLLEETFLDHFTSRNHYRTFLFRRLRRHKARLIIRRTRIINSSSNWGTHIY
jgi:hypothetical protein